MSSYLKLISHPSALADATLTGAEAEKGRPGNCGSGTDRNVIKLSKRFQKYPTLSFSSVLKQTFDRLPHPHSCSFPAADWDSQTHEKTIVQRGSLESGPVAPTKLGAGLFVQIAARHAIGGRISEDIITVLPDTRGTEHTIPQIELSVGKPRI